MSNSDKANLTRYKELLSRALFELKLAHDLAVSLKLSYKRTSRLQRARKELFDEKEELKKVDAPAIEKQG
jgi:hypothetical protein